MIRRRYLLPLLSALVLANCGGPKPKPPPVLTLTMIGSAEQNPNSDGKAQPVAVRVYQLTQTAKFERVDVFALTEHEQQALGQDSVSSQEFVLSPGETQTKQFELKSGVQAIGVAVTCIATSTMRSGAPMRRPPTAGRRNSY